jgi:hypothetical protein
MHSGYSGKSASYQESSLPLLAARIYGVIRRPRATFAAIVQAPSWAPVLAVTTVVMFVCPAGFLSTAVGKQALVDQWERTATAFGQPVDDARYTQMEARAESGGASLLYAAATALGYGPVLVFAVSGVLFLVLRSRHSYTQILAVVAWAGVILALRQVIATPIEYVQESLASPTTLVRMFSMLDEASPLARFLGVIDLFVVWWIVMLAVGISALSHRSTRRLALAFTGAYVVLALLAALVMAISGGAA